MVYSVYLLQSHSFFLVNSLVTFKSLGVFCISIECNHFFYIKQLRLLLLWLFLWSKLNTSRFMFYKHSRYVSGMVSSHQNLIILYLSSVLGLKVCLVHSSYFELPIHKGGAGPIEPPLAAVQWGSGQTCGRYGCYFSQAQTGGGAGHSWALQALSSLKASLKKLIACGKMTLCGLASCCSALIFGAWCPVADSQGKAILESFSSQSSIFPIPTNH